MATHDHIADHGHVADQDYRDHVASYRSFLYGVRISVAAVVTVLALMAYFLLA